MAVLQTGEYVPPKREPKDHQLTYAWYSKVLKADGTYKWDLQGLVTQDSVYDLTYLTGYSLWHNFRKFR